MVDTTIIFKSVNVFKFAPVQKKVRVDVLKIMWHFLYIYLFTVLMEKI